MQPGGLERVAQLLENMGGGLVQDGKHELDPVAVGIGYLAGQVETLMWAQQKIADALAAVGRYEDPRPIEGLLSYVQDELRRVQNGSPVAVA